MVAGIDKQGETEAAEVNDNVENTLLCKAAQSCCVDQQKGACYCNADIRQHHSCNSSAEREPRGSGKTVAHTSSYQRGTKQVQGES